MDLQQRIAEAEKKFFQGRISYDQYHLRQYREMYRNTASFIEFIKRFVSPDQPQKVLDVGCGGGANIYWMRQAFPHWEIMGLDIDCKMLEFAKFMNPDVEFVCIDFGKALELWEPKSFDYLTAIHFLPAAASLGLEGFLSQALPLARKGIFISALFSEGWIEQHTYMFDYEENVRDDPMIVYSLERMKQLIPRWHSGPVRVIYEPFEIDIDLPKPPKPKFGTYTVKTADGKRLQISGYMLMPWYHVFIDLQPQ